LGDSPVRAIDSGSGRRDGEFAATKEVFKMMGRRLTAVIVVLAALAVCPVAGAASPGDVGTAVVNTEDSFFSGSCSGEEVAFTGFYHEVIHYRYDENGNPVQFNVMTGESNFGTGIGQRTGDKYIRIYRQNSTAQYAFDPYTGTFVGTYLTQVLHLGPDGSLVDDDMWIRSVVQITDTADGWVRHVENMQVECFG
jgi:hypothetical protein